LSAAPEATAEIRGLDTLALLFKSLGTSKFPAIIAIDDFQWADDLSIKFLTHWARQIANPRFESHTLILVAYRTEDVPHDHPIRSIRFSPSLALHPLDLESIQSLVESMAGPVPKELPERVLQISNGNPFMASAFMRGMVESGALVHEGDHWIF